MNFIKYTVAASLFSGVVSAQGLFDINPNEDLDESIPLTYTFGVQFGYDDNVNPINPVGFPAVSDESSAYVAADLSANLAVRDPQTAWDINVGVGVTHYLDDVRDNDTAYDANLAFNFNHRISDRTRFVSRNFVNYGLDLGNFFGALTNRQVDEFLYLSTDNAIGYRWTDRLATYTGVTYSTLQYEGDDLDVDTYTVYNQFRYILNPQTTLTATGRYTFSDFGNGDDSDRVGATVGVERQLSPTSAIVAQVGVQFGEENTSAFVNVHYNKQVTQQLKARAFVRYSQEDTDTIFVDPTTGPAFTSFRYEDKQVLRIGGAVDYTLSPQLVLTLGGNYTFSDFSESTGGQADADWDLFSVYTGLTYQLSPAFSVNASVNFTDSSADTILNRDYDRIRYEVGANYTF